MQVGHMLKIKHMAMYFPKCRPTLNWCNKANIVAFMYRSLSMQVKVSPKNNATILEVRVKDCVDN